MQTDQSKTNGPRSLKRVVSWLADCMDQQPDTIKAMAVIVVLMAGFKGLYEGVALMFYAIVSLTMKAS